MEDGGILHLLILFSMKIDIDEILNGTSIILLNEGDMVVDDDITIGNVVSDIGSEEPCKSCLLYEKDCYNVRCEKVYIKKFDGNFYAEQGGKLIDMNHAVNRICNSDVCPFYESGCINEDMMHNNSRLCMINILFKD